MYPDSDLEMLMARYQQGDFAAATALIHRLSPQLHRYFVVQLASRGDADDLLQETWLRIHQVRHTYRAGWRTAGREESLERMPEPAAAPPPGAEKDADLETILAHLPESQREVIEMRSEERRVGTESRSQGA